MSYNVDIMNNKTKIIATIGPASENKDVIKKIIDAGADLVRFNMSHGAIDDVRKAIKTVRAINPNIGILLDLQGPRIRTGRLKDACVSLQKGSKFLLTTKQVEGNETMVSVDHKDLPSMVKAGQKIMVDNGLIELKVISVSGADINTQVVTSGMLGEHKGINVPGISIFKRAITDKDVEDIKLAVEADVDYIGLSFIKNPDDVIEAKKVIEANGGDIAVIAKIENPEALPKLDAIINISDAIMVARGDLGVELEPQDVPMIQKEIIRRSAKAGKPVIVASQMLESMISSPIPTRAETTDVANAIIDGADALMLSEETAAGMYPVKAVEMMAKIINKVEEEGKIISNLEKSDIKQSIALAVSHSAYHICEDIGCKAIISFTTSGSTALMASKWRPTSPIFACVTSEKAARRVSLYWGVQPIKMDKFVNTDEMILKAQEAVLSQRLLSKGDLVVITAGVPIGVPGTTNLLKVHKIG